MRVCVFDIIMIKKIVYVRNLLMDVVKEIVIIIKYWRNVWMDVMMVRLFNFFYCVKYRV